MTEEQINIAIAESCGFHLTHEKDEVWIWYNGYVPEFCKYPNYCNDLNAMNEAVMTLPENKRVLYGVRLAWECGHLDKNKVGLWNIATAKAYHKAVAFLKTIEKWEEA